MGKNKSFAIGCAHDGHETNGGDDSSPPLITVEPHGDGHGDGHGDTNDGGVIHVHYGDGAHGEQCHGLRLTAQTPYSARGGVVNGGGVGSDAAAWGRMARPAATEANRAFCTTASVSDRSADRQRTRGGAGGILVGLHEVFAEWCAVVARAVFRWFGDRLTGGGTMFLAA